MTETAWIVVAILIYFGEFLFLALGILIFSELCMALTELVCDILNPKDDEEDQ